MIGNILRNRYQILRKLGGGGFGDTYLAQDLDLPGCPSCVVKHLKPKHTDPDILLMARRLFEREARVLYELGQKYQQFPKVFAHFEEDQEFYLVQEYIEGHNLTQELFSGQPLSEQQVIILLKDIFEVVALIHECNIIHRDIKPANLMRRYRDGKIVLIDFGAVKEISTLIVNPQGHTNFTIAVGSPGYMPSEQAAGKPRLSSDVYAVGMIGIQALTGIKPDQLPEDMRTGEILWRDRTSTSTNFAAILDKMVRYHFNQRYSDANEALAAIIPLASSLNSIPIVNKSPQNLSIEPTEPLVIRQPVVPQSLAPNLSTFEFTVVTVNQQGKTISREIKQGRMFIEDLGSGIALEMVYIPGGKFLMGSPETEQGRSNTESPQHWVTVPGFYMGKYPVTQEQYQVLTGTNPSYFRGRDSSSKQPVERVSWSAAVIFCKRLSKLTRKNYKLPSESQWEYACRAGTITPFHFGETLNPKLANYNREKHLKKRSAEYFQANNASNVFDMNENLSELQEHSQEGTKEVGYFQIANAFGLYDMHGNVWEWCQDIWHYNYEGAPTNGSPWESGENSRYRLLRGGSWFDSGGSCRSAYRSDGAIDYDNFNCGFRVCIPREYIF